MQWWIVPPVVYRMTDPFASRSLASTETDMRTIKEVVHVAPNIILMTNQHASAVGFLENMKKSPEGGSAVS